MKNFSTNFSGQYARIQSMHPSAPEIDNETGLRRIDPVNDMVLVLDGGVERNVPRDWFGKTMPRPGGYLLTMADGALEYMPGAVFEAIFPEAKPIPVVATSF